MIAWLSDNPDAPFPALDRAQKNPNGLLAAGGDLSAERLLHAYKRGIFPWYSEGEPILWWSPDPRCVLFTDRIHVPRRLARRMRQSKYHISFDTAFDEVIHRCAAPRGNQPETWITSEMINAYVDLHRAGYAHSIEIWNQGELAGGVYGVALGRMFFAESMFACQTDASKMALVSLCRQLSAWGFPLIDCQVANAHLFSMGAEMITRDEFAGWLKYAAQPGPEKWKHGSSPARA